MITTEARLAALERTLERVLANQGRILAAVERQHKPSGLGRLDRALLDAIAECFARGTFTAGEVFADPRLMGLLRPAGLMTANALGRRFEKYLRLGYVSRVQRGAQGWIYELVYVA
jgi:hypothetical protein